MNRRRRQLRLRPLGWLESLVGSLKRVRLPRLRRTNRRKFSLLRAPGDAPETTDGTTTAQPPRRGRIGLVFAWLAPFVLAVVAFSAPIFGVKAVDYVRASQHFQVKEIFVEGHRRLDATEVTRLCGIEAGMSVLEADLDGLAAPLRAHPWVRWARVDRQLPDRLVVQLIEREAAAYLTTGELWLVDETGEVFAPAEAGEPLEIPVISGVSEDELTEAMADPAKRAQLQIRLQAALNLSRTWTLVGLARRYPIGEVRVDPARGFVVVAGGAGSTPATEIVLGEEPFRAKLQRLEFTLEALRTQGRNPHYVLLDVDDETLHAPPRTDLGMARHLRGARVIVRTDDVQVEDDGGEPVPSEGAPFVGPPMDAPAPAAEAPRRETPTARSDTETNPNEATPPDAAEPETETPSEAVPVSGGRPADISAGMEE
jgi:hypothetical protein